MRARYAVGVMDPPFGLSRRSLSSILVLFFFGAGPRGANGCWFPGNSPPDRLTSLTSLALVRRHSLANASPGRLHDLPRDQRPIAWTRTARGHRVVRGIQRAGLPAQPPPLVERRAALDLDWRLIHRRRKLESSITVGQVAMCPQRVIAIVILEILHAFGVVEVATEPVGAVLLANGSANLALR